MKTTAVFDKLYDAWREHPRYVSSCGGARSSKTYSMLELLFYLATTYDKAGDVTSVVSETFPHLKRGAIRDFKNIIGESWDEDAWSKSESIYTLQNGAIIEFFSADAVGKVHGPQRKRLFLNEVQNIPYETARQLFIRTQDTVFMDYNPTHSFWVNEIIEQRPDCRLVHSTYKDNPFLSPEQVREIESNKNDTNWWRVYGEGKVGQLEGLIFPEFTLVDDLPAPADRPDGMIESYGLDYGFTNDPSALIHSLTDNRKREVWWDEVFYRIGMLNADMAAAMKQEGISRNIRVWADSAEPKTNEELKRYGFNIWGSFKSTKKAEQVQAMRGYRYFVTKRSLNLIREMRGYTWQKDKDGKLLNEPIAFNDHCFVAGTMVRTPHGETPIEQVKVGDMVMTSEGPRVVENWWNNGCKKVLRVKFIFCNFSVEITATPEHKFKTQKGWKELQKIKKGDTLLLFSTLTESRLGNTKENVIIQTDAPVCTAMCGSSTMAKSQKGMTYTTKTETPITTPLRTSNVLQKKNTTASMPKNGNCVACRKNNGNTLHIFRNSQNNGTPAQRVWNGTGSMELKEHKTYPNARPFVNAVVGHLHTDIYNRKNSAPINVKVNGGETTDLTMKNEFANGAGNLLSQTTIQKQNVVQSFVVQDLQVIEEKSEEVFDIQVEEMHEFFANGILVHNCMDAGRYAVFPSIKVHRETHSTLSRT